MSFKNLCKKNWLLLLSVTLVSGCGFPEMAITHIGGDLTPGDFNYPKQNPAPMRTLVISGTASPSLKLQLVAHYLTNGSTFCTSTPSFIAGAVEGATRPTSVSIPLQIIRNGDSYSTNAVVDQFIPGKCDWQFGYVTANLSKGNFVSMPNLIIRARDGWHTPYVETVTENGTDAPVVLRCEFQRLSSDDSHTQSNACITRTGIKNHDKREHHFLNKTKSVEANFIDDDGS